MLDAIADREIMRCKECNKELKRCYYCKDDIGESNIICEESGKHFCDEDCWTDWIVRRHKNESIETEVKIINKKEEKEEQHSIMNAGKSIWGSPPMANRFHWSPKYKRKGISRTTQSKRRIIYR